MPAISSAVNTTPGRVVRAVDPDDPRARRDGGGDRVEVGVKAPVGAQRHGHQARAARADHRRVGVVDRLGHDHLVAGPGEALQSAEEAALGAGRDDDILGAAGLPGSPLEARRDRLPHTRVADNRGIAGAMPAQRFDRRFDHRLRRRLVGIADGQDDDILAGVAQTRRLDMHAPGPGAPPDNAIDQR